MPKHVPAPIVYCSDKQKQLDALSVRVPSQLLPKLLSEYLGKLKRHIRDHTLRHLGNEHGLRKHYMITCDDVRIIYRE